MPNCHTQAQLGIKLCLDLAGSNLQAGPLHPGGQFQTHKPAKANPNRHFKMSGKCLGGV